MNDLSPHRPSDKSTFENQRTREWITDSWYDAIIIHSLFETVQSTSFNPLSVAVPEKKLAAADKQPTWRPTFPLGD
jgi:hypothetical protein